jgi:hypothetical protein
MSFSRLSTISNNGYSSHPASEHLMKTVARLHSAVINQKTSQIPLLVKRAVKLLPSDI